MKRTDSGERTRLPLRRGLNPRFCGRCALALWMVLFTVSACGSDGDEPEPADGGPAASGMTLWARSYGGSLAETMRTVACSPDGEFLLAGETETYSGGEPNAWLVRVDPQGNAIWANAAGGDDLGFSAVMGIAPTADGGAFVCGEVQDDSSLYSSARLVARLTATGGILWLRESGDPAPSSERPQAVAATSDGGCVVAGGMRTTIDGDWQIQVAKVGPQGDVEWVHTDPFLGMATAVTQTSDGEYLVAGHTLGDFPKRAFALRLGPTGTPTYRTIAFSGEGLEFRALTVRQNTIGGFLLTAHCETDDTVYAWVSEPNGTVSDQYATGTDAEYIWLDPTPDGEYVMLTRDGQVIKLNGEFVETWRVHSPVVELDHFVRVSMTGTNRYTVVGVLNSQEEFLVDLEVDPDGTLVQQSLKIVASGDPEFMIAEEAGSGGSYFVGGSRISGGWVRKLDADRDPLWSTGPRAGNTDSVRDACVSSAASGFDGYVVAGSIESAEQGDRDLWIYAVDTGGGLLWERVYGRTFEDPAPAIHDSAQAIVPTADGYLVAGSTQSAEGSEVFWVLNLDGAGDVVTENVLHAPEVSGNQRATCLTGTADGGAVVAGTTSSGDEPEYGILVVRLDENLDPLWATEIHHADTMRPSAVLETRYDQDGDGMVDTFYVVAGTITFSDADVYVVLLDENGNVLSRYAYRGVGEETCVGLVPALCGGYAIAGTTTSWGGGQNCGETICPNYFLLALTRDLDIDWLRTYSTAESDTAHVVREVPGGGYLIGGVSDGITGNPDFWAIRTDPWGQLTEACPAGLAEGAEAIRLPVGGDPRPVDVSSDGSGYVEVEEPHPPYLTADFTETVQCRAGIGLWTLSVSVSGGGRVTSDPGCIDCGRTCEFVFWDGESVTLTAHSEPQWEFDRWSGDCSGTEDEITVSMSDHLSCTAVFVEQVPPSPPTGVTAVPGDGENTVSWAAVTGAASYNLYWDTNTGVTTADNRIPGATSPHVHTGLTNGTTYYYVVTAENSYGESGVSSEASATPQTGTPPSPPSGVTAVPGDGENTVSWAAVTGAASYNLYWDTNTGVTTADNRIPGATSPHVHTGLTNGTTYYYAVTAENSYGESGVSSEASATPTPQGCSDVSGVWLFEVSSVTSTCGSEDNWSSTVTINQTDCSLETTGIKGTSHIVSGSVQGTLVTIGPGYFPEDGGTTTATYTLHAHSETFMSGAESWDWSGPGAPCIDGTAAVTATKQ